MTTTHRHLCLTLAASYAEENGATTPEQANEWAAAYLADGTAECVCDDYAPATVEDEPTPAPAPSPRIALAQFPGVHVIDLQYIAPGIFRLIVAPGQERAAAACALQAGWDVAGSGTGRITVDTNPQD